MQKTILDRRRGVPRGRGNQVGGFNGSGGGGSRMTNPELHEYKDHLVRYQVYKCKVSKIEKVD